MMAKFLEAYMRHLPASGPLMAKVTAAYMRQSASMSQNTPESVYQL